MAGVEQNRYKTNNECIKHLPQTGRHFAIRNSYLFVATFVSLGVLSLKILLWKFPFFNKEPKCKDSGTSEITKTNYCYHVIEVMAFRSGFKILFLVFEMISVVALATRIEGNQVHSYAEQYC